MLLTGAYFFSYMDRQILSILQEHIKADLHLTDAQLGLLAGFAFAIFYATLGIPVARLADRANRISIVAISLSLWSLMTAFCGIAQNFAQLLAARIGVGVGEAGSSPPSHSIIADLYPPEKRAGAMSIYSLGIVLGGGVGTMIGGGIAYLFGWRAAMISIGLPGLLLALAIKRLAVEPPRGFSEPGRHGAQDQPGFRAGVSGLISDPAARALVIALAISILISYGNGAFVPSYLQRSFGMEMVTIAMVFAPIFAVVGSISALAGGWMADRVAARHGFAGQCWLLVILKLLALPANVLAYLSTSWPQAVTWLVIDGLLTSSVLGTVFAIIQGLAPINARALWASIALLLINLVGMGLGPTLVGALSDYLKPSFGPESLRYAMLSMQALTPLGLIAMAIAARSMQRRRSGLPATAKA